MISHIMTGKYLRAKHTMTPTIGSNGDTSGTVKYNTTNQRLEVFDGIRWVDMCHTASVELDLPATLVIQWAEKKMEQEIALESLARKYPSVQTALDAAREANNNLHLISLLYKE